MANFVKLAENLTNLKLFTMCNLVKLAEKLETCNTYEMLDVYTLKLFTRYKETWKLGILKKIHSSQTVKLKILVKLV